MQNNENETTRHEHFFRHFYRHRFLLFFFFLLDRKVNIFWGDAIKLYQNNERTLVHVIYLKFGCSVKLTNILQIIYI